MNLRASSRRAGKAHPSLLERAGALAANVGVPGSAYPRARLVVQLGIGVLILGVLLGFIASQWSELPDFDWRFSPGWLALAAVAVLAFLVIQGEIWRLILRSLGEELDERPAQAIYATSLLARYVPSNILMVVGRIVMAGRYGVRRRVCLASMAYEAGLALCAAIVVGSYFVVTLPALEGQPARYAALGLVPLALLVLHPKVFQPIADYALGKLGREALPKPLPFSRVLFFTSLYVLDLVVVGLGVLAFTAALHPVEGSEVSLIVSSYAVSFSVAMLTFVVPGALGTRDTALALALTAVLPVTVAAAIAVAFRLLQTAAEVVYFAGSRAIVAVAGEPA